ncbi:MAG: Lrp/AsnC family transcriptional regulator [Clostridia bacterium]|nr:Lrp/AsnC family transcriptional regulator [Clostridia bacterium]
MKSVIDNTDLEILKLLQDDARISVKSISEKVYISQPTVSARIEEMTKKGIIKGYFTEIDDSVFNDNIKAYIDMEVSPERKEELYSLLKESKQVLECNRVTGEYSLLIKVVFKNTVDMDKFINTLQHYGRTKTQIVFSTVISRRGVIL